MSRSIIETRCRNPLRDAGARPRTTQHATRD
jgi:hypothetical protein